MEYECIKYHIGSDGFRTVPFHKKEGPRIVTVGDSFTFGEGVKEEEGFYVRD